MMMPIVSEQFLDLETLITMLMDDPSDSLTLEALTQRLAPTILGEAMKYRRVLPYDTDDYMQEGRIVLWQIAMKRNYKAKNFRNYFISAIRFHFCKMYEKYIKKNHICIGGYEDLRGNTFSILVEDANAERYRELDRARNRRYIAKKKANQPPKEPRMTLTPEERRERSKARSLAYYYAHKDEMNARAKEKRRLARLQREKNSTRKDD